MQKRLIIEATFVAHTGTELVVRIPECCGTTDAHFVKHFHPDTRAMNRRAGDPVQYWTDEHGVNSFIFTS